MTLRRLLLLCLLLPFIAVAEEPPLLLIFDASGSMNERLGPERKVDAAKRVTREMLAEFPGNVPLGVTLFGHRRAKDCSDIEAAIPFATADSARRRQIADRIQGLDAKGETPIARVLTESVALFQGRPGRILLVTDGREECGGDVCAAADALAAKGIAVRVDIVGFRLRPEDRQALACITGRTGGRYYDAADADRLKEALRSATEEAAPGGKLEVNVTEGGQRAANVMVTVRDEAGRMVTGLAENPARFQLPPGRYQVSARAGSGVDSAPVAVEVELKKGAQRTIEVGTGTLDIELIAGGRALAPVPNFQLFRAGTVFTSPSYPPRRFQAGAGEYELRAALATGENATLGTVTIEAGKTRTVQLEVPLTALEVEVSGNGFVPGRGPFPRVELTRDGRFAGALNDNPAKFVLLAGEYRLTVKDVEGRAVTERVITLQPGPITRLRVP